MTGFFYIIASVICSIAIAHLLKLARNKELSIVPILTVNYAVASLISGFQIEHLDVITDALLQHWFLLFSRAHCLS